MESKITFGRWEAAALLINAVCARIFLNFPRPVIEDSLSAAWVETIYFSVLILLAFALINKLYDKFEGRDLLDISNEFGGAVARIIVGLIITCLLIFIGSIILREYGENMKIIALNTSPISFVLLFFAIGMVLGAYAGIEAIVRFHAIVVPIIIAGLLLIFIGNVNDFDFSNIFPILGPGPINILQKGLSRISLYAPVLYLFLMYPYIKKRKIFKAAGFTGIIISALLLVSTTFTFLLAFPYPTALESFLPVYQLARLINYGRFFQRVESIFMLIWAASALLYLSVILFFAVHSFKAAFRLQHHKPLIIPFAIIIFTTSLIPQNLFQAIALETKYYTMFAWIVTLAMPVVILLAARLVRKVKKKAGANNE